MKFPTCVRLKCFRSGTSDLPANLLSSFCLQLSFSNNASSLKGGGGGGIYSGAGFGVPFSTFPLCLLVSAT